MGLIHFSVNFDSVAEIEMRLERGASRAEEALAYQVKDDTEKFVPATGAPAGQYRRTFVNGNAIIYEGPYAKYLYFGKYMVNRKTGKGPSHYIDKNGEEVIKYPFGSKLRPTNRPLKIKTAFHKDATSKWFEVSKRENLQKWERFAAAAIRKGL